MVAVIPSSLLRLIEALGEEEASLLLGRRVGELLVVEGMAFTPCKVSTRSFECLPLPREDLLGVVHRHEDDVSSRDMRIAKLWPLYAVLTGKGLKAFSYGEEIKVILV